MRGQRIAFFVAGVLLTMMFGLLQTTLGQTDPDQPGLGQDDLVRVGPGPETLVDVGPVVPVIETQGDNRREVDVPEGMAPTAPLIGFIDSPTATCYQPDHTVDACYINWYYLSVSASPNYMITMTVTLNDFGPVAHYTGFFQQSMYAPYNLNGQGFKVPCGDLGSGGQPLLGQAYGWTIRARDSANLGSANYGTVYCPAYVP